MKISSELITTSTKNINEKSHFIETNSELTNEEYEISTDLGTTKEYKTETNSWTETNQLNPVSTENIKENSEIKENSYKHDFYSSSEIFNSELTINTPNESKNVSEFSTYPNTMSHSTDAENNIIDISEKVTNEDTYISESIIGTKTNERNKGSDIISDSYISYQENKISFKISTDLVTNTDQLSDINSESTSYPNEIIKNISSEILDSKLGGSDFYPSSDIYSESNFNETPKDIEMITHSIITDNSIIDTSDNVLDKSTNENKYITESIIDTNTNEKKIYSSEINSESNFERTTDFTTTDNKFSDIISHSSMDIIKNKSTELSSDSSIDSNLSSDSIIKTNESYQSIFNTNTNENKYTNESESNSIESEIKLSSDTAKMKIDYSSEITSTSQNYPKQSSFIFESNRQKSENELHGTSEGLIDLSTNPKENRDTTFYSSNINETMKLSSEFISTSSKNINEKTTHFIETNSELTNENYYASTETGTTKEHKTETGSWTEINKIVSDTSENIKESSEMISNSFVHESSVIKSQSNINTNTESEITSEFSTNMNSEKDNKQKSYTIITENNIIDISDNISTLITNENTYITESIIDTNTNEKNTYDNSYMSYGSYSTDLKSESSFSTDNKMPGIISHSSMNIIEKTSSEISSDSSNDNIKQSDSKFKTSEINESSQNFFNTNTYENKHSVITESNSIESEIKLSDSRDVKSDLSSKILSSEAENSIEQISDYSSSSTSIINPFYSSLESEQKNESELYDSTQGKIDLSTNTYKNIDLVTTDLSTKENILTSDSSIISKESSDIISSNNTYDFYESSQIFNTEPNITIYNESEIASQFSTNINNYSQDINPISYSINTENSIIENSENNSNVRTNEYTYRSESIIHSNTNEKNTYGISDMSYGLYTTDIQSESNFERTTDFTTTDNKFSDIISHSSMDINRTTEKYNSEIASDSSFDTIKQSDSTIKTSEISESYKGIYSTNNIKENENKDSFIAETNSMESEKKLITDSEEIIKKDSSEIISTNSKKELINYSSEILYNTSGRSEETYKYYSSISDYSEFKYENKTDLTTNSIKTSDISFESSQKIISSSNEYINETNLYDISTISSSINKEKSSDSYMNSNQPQETNFDSSFIQTENETKILDTILNTKESESYYSSNIMSDTNLKSTTKTYDYSSNIISIPNQTDKQSTSKTTTEWITTKESSIDTILGSTSKIDEIVKESSDLINDSNKNTYYKDNKSEIGLESNMETELSSQSIDRLTDTHMIINESTIDFKNDASKFSNKEVFSNSIETSKYSSEIIDSQKSIIKESSEIISDTTININESQSDYSSNIISDTNIKTTEKFERSSEIITFPTETENQSTLQPKTEGREDNGSTSIINENTDSNIISSSAIKTNTDKFIDTASEISQDSSVKLNITYNSESFKKMSDSNIITNSDTILSSNSYIGEKTLITSQSDSKESSEIISYTTPKVNENQSDYSSYIISDTDIKIKETFISSSDTNNNGQGIRY